MGLRAELGAGPVAVDTAVFIYFIEEHPRFLAPARALFQGADAGALEVVTSVVTLLEVLVVPYRSGNDPLAERYEGILTRSPGVRLIELDGVQIRTAARLRALYGVRTPDALQLAAALTTGCSAMVTNDRRLPSISGLRVVQLSDLV